MRRLVALGALIWSALGGDASGLELRAAIAGPPETVFDRASQRCDENDIPDTALHAFRREDGQIVGFASHYLSRAFLIASDGTFARDCKVVFAGSRSPEPAAFDDRIWIATPWTADGKRVFALGHDEYQGDTHPGRCKYPAYLQCWYNAVVLLESSDGGGSFHKIADVPPIAAAGYTFDAHQGAPRGFFGSTNILAVDDWYYAIIYANGGGSQPQGNCLFRARAVGDAASWEYWTGAGFVPSAYDPYAGQPAPPPCRPLAGLLGRVWSLVRHRASGLYVATLGAQNPKAPSGAISLVTSADLFHWSRPKPLLEVSMLWGKGCNKEGARYSYAALLDLTSTDRNFDDIGDAPYLYVTRLPLTDCRITLDRDLIRYPLRLETSR